LQELAQEVCISCRLPCLVLHPTRCSSNPSYAVFKVQKVAGLMAWVLLGVYIAGQ